MIQLDLTPRSAPSSTTCLDRDNWRWVAGAAAGAARAGLDAHRHRHRRALLHPHHRGRRPPGQPPTHPERQADLRLPFEKILVLFGADLELDPANYPWPGRFPFHELSSFGIVNDLIRRGGYLTGMVLLADEDGRLRDDAVWIVAANPNPELPWPASLDRIRGPVRGWRAAADLGPLVDNVAAALAWAPWRQPPPPPSIPTEPTSRSLRKALRRNAIRVRERHGALVGVRVLDLGRSLAHTGQTEPVADHGRQRASPIPHLRSGHFRHVRVGPRASFHYEVRWIPPVWVQGDTDRAAQQLVVRRIPPPATWAKSSAQQLRGPGEQGRPVPAHLEEPPRPLPGHPVTDHDPFGIDLP